MRKDRVKIITASTLPILEEDVNKWLKQYDGNDIDIGTVNVKYDGSRYFAVVPYQIWRPDCEG